MTIRANDLGVSGYTRIGTRLDRWEGGAIQGIDPPTESREVGVEWLTPTGRPVTSERQIARLNARYRRLYQQDRED